jgi:hypothetical protein
MEGYLWTIHDIINIDSPFIANVTLGYDPIADINVSPSPPPLTKISSSASTSFKKYEGFNYFRSFPLNRKKSSVKITVQEYVKEDLEITCAVEYYQGDTGLFVNQEL